MQDIIQPVDRSLLKAELTKEANDAYFNNLLTNWVSKIDKDYTYSKSVNTDVYSMITFS